MSIDYLGSPRIETSLIKACQYLPVSVAHTSSLIPRQAALFQGNFHHLCGTAGIFMCGSLVLLCQFAEMGPVLSTVNAGMVVPRDCSRMRGQLYNCVAAG